RPVLHTFQGFVRVHALSLSSGWPARQISPASSYLLAAAPFDDANPGWVFCRDASRIDVQDQVSARAGYRFLGARVEPVPANFAPVLDSRPPGVTDGRVKPPPAKCCHGLRFHKARVLCPLRKEYHFRLRNQWRNSPPRARTKARTTHA